MYNGGRDAWTSVGQLLHCRDHVLQMDWWICCHTYLCLIALQWALKKLQNNLQRCLHAHKVPGQVDIMDLALLHALIHDALDDIIFIPVADRVRQSQRRFCVAIAKVLSSQYRPCG